MKPKNYRILLILWIGLILFFLGQFLYTNLFQTIYPSILDKLYAITSFLWKYFLSLLAMSFFAMLQPFDTNQKETISPIKEGIEAVEKEKDKGYAQETIDGIPISKRAKTIIVSIMLILAFFLVRHVILVNVYSNYYLIVWNFIYGHIFITATSGVLLILVFFISFKNAKIADVKNEI